MPGKPGVRYDLWLGQYSSVSYFGRAVVRTGAVGWVEGLAGVPYQLCGIFGVCARHRNPLSSSCHDGL
jgi:hypothetical protein